MRNSKPFSMASSEFFSTAMLSVESVKRKLNFEETRIIRLENEVIRVPIWKKMKGRQLDFGETDPSVLCYCLDLLPNRPKHDSGRIIFTRYQRSKLEALFQKDKFPSRDEKAELAEDIKVPLSKVTTWFANRRQKWRRQQEKAAVLPSRFRPIQPSSNSRSTQSHSNVSRTAEFPSIPPPWFSSTPHPIRAPQQSASLASQPCQYFYSAFPVPVLKPSQKYPEPNYKQTEASYYPAAYDTMPARDPVTVPSDSQLEVSSAARKSLADEFPFSCSIARELPHIFGNVDEDEVLDRPLTPSFEAPVEFDSISEPSSFDSEESAEIFSDPCEDLAYCDQPRRFDSCCFGNYKPLPAAGNVISKGENFAFFRQD